MVGLKTPSLSADSQLFSEDSFISFGICGDPLVFHATKTNVARAG
jgi:hypothetical protein